MHHAQDPVRTRTLLIGIASLLGLCLAAPTWSFSDLSIAVNPLQPLVGEDFFVEFSGTSDGLVTLQDVEIGPSGAVTVTVASTPCVPACGAQLFDLSVPIQGSASLLPRGAYRLTVRSLTPEDFERLINSQFTVGETVYHSLRPEIVFEQSNANDNEPVRILIATEPTVCGPSPPVLDRVEQQDNTISVFLRYGSLFGPGFFGATTGPTRCSPAVPFLSALAVDLGVLPPGPYELSLYLQSLTPFSLPGRTHRRPFEVADAPDVVTLQSGRFNVSATWADFSNNTGVGKPVPNPSNDSTLLSFFGEENWEALVKVLDGCAINGHYWVLAAVASNVEYTLLVEDTSNDAVWTFDNALGDFSPSVADIAAFPCGP